MPHRPSRVCQVGAGNIGSRLADLIVREAGLARFTIIDRDVYSADNLAGQDVGLRDLGESKVLAQARRLRAIHPRLEVVTYHEDLASVPLGALRADLILGALDSRHARLLLNRAARHLNVPWIDGGIDAAASLVRVTGYGAGEDAPCAACGADANDLAAAAPSLPCGGGGSATAARAPGHLGAVAAGVMAAEAARILNGEVDGSILGREVLLELRHRHQDVTNLRLDLGCGLHRPTTQQSESAEPLSVWTCLRALLPAARALRAPGKLFSMLQSCRQCGSTTAEVQLVPSTLGPCSCGGDRLPTGFEARDRLDLESLRSADLRRSLRSIGVRPAEVLDLELHDGSTRRVECGDPRR